MKTVSSFNSSSLSFLLPVYLDFNIKSESEIAQSVQIFATPWTVAYQNPPSMGFSRQDYWSGLPFPSPGDLPTQGSNLGLLRCRQTLYCLGHQGSLIYILYVYNIYIYMNILYVIYIDR